MKKSQIAVQLFTLRKFLTTSQDIVKTMTKIRKIGFSSVQISGMAPISEDEIVKILSGEGLTCCATHESGKDIIECPEKVIARLNKLNCKYTAYPAPHKIPITENDTIELAKQLNTSAKKMRTHGIILTYHNHDIEFQRIGKQTMLDIIYANAPDLQSEIDTFWVQAGGANPVTWIKGMKGKAPLLHLKEFGVIDRVRTMLPLGAGNLEWSKIIPAAEKSGTEWFIIEQDECLKDPFDCLKESLDFLNTNYAK